MSKAAYPLKLPASIKEAAARLAKEDGVSLNQWISVAIAQKIGAVDGFRPKQNEAKARLPVSSCIGCVSRE